jgi:hypothetical protein
MRSGEHAGPLSTWPDLPERYEPWHMCWDGLGFPPRYPGLLAQAWGSRPPSRDPEDRQATNTSTSAEAAYEHCSALPGFCVWENQAFTGRMGVAQLGCDDAWELGLAVIGSARRGYVPRALPGPEAGKDAARTPRPGIPGAVEAASAPCRRHHLVNRFSGRLSGPGEVLRWGFPIVRVAGPGARRRWLALGGKRYPSADGWHKVRTLSREWKKKRTTHA